jgi:hypothetical protein
MLPIIIPLWYSSLHCKVLYVPLIDAQQASTQTIERAHMFRCGSPQMYDKTPSYKIATNSSTIPSVRALFDYLRTGFRAYITASVAPRTSAHNRTPRFACTSTTRCAADAADEGAPDAATLAALADAELAALAGANEMLEALPVTDALEFAVRVGEPAADAGAPDGENPQSAVRNCWPVALSKMAAEQLTAMQPA